MSRLIVKNLPLGMTVEKLKKKFDLHGTVTDIKLMYTRSGKFRRFAFVGYQLEEEADRAKNYMDKSLILNQRIAIEMCRNFGVQDKAKIQNNVLSVENKRKFENIDDTKNADQSHDEEIEGNTADSDSNFLNLKRKHDFHDDDEEVSEDESEESKSVEGEDEVRYDVRMRGCPFNVKKQQIKEFFYPLNPTDITIQTTECHSRTGTVFVHFSSENDRLEALKHNGDYISNRYIELFKQSTFIVNKPINQDKLRGWEKQILDGHKYCDIEDISESGRIFIRNLSFSCTEDNLRITFEKFGPLSEVGIPLDNLTRKSVGFGFVTFMFPEHALKAFNEMDGTVFQGRMLHILPAKAKIEHDSSTGPGAQSSYKKDKAAAEKKSSQSSHNWNALFMGTDAVADAIAEKYSTDKSEILDSTNKHSAAVRLALGETQVVKETRDFLIDNGIALDVFSQPNAERSKTVIIAKNLPVGATCSELREMFEKHAELGRVVLAPAGVTAVVECLVPSEAKSAFTKLAYRKFHHKPLYLEWAPVGTFLTAYNEKKIETSEITDIDNKKSEDIDKEDDADDALSESLTLFVKNLNFDTTDEGLKNHFTDCGALLSSTVSRKKTHRQNDLLSMGYGFVTFKRKADGKKALKTLQHSMLDGHKLELKLSERQQPVDAFKTRKRQQDKKQLSSKILVRNVPFQAHAREIESLFKSFGELKTVRLPKKLSVGDGQGGNHRGFAFVDFVTKQDAKNAFNALCHSTHLYGRRMVLEWAHTEENSIEGLRRKTSEHYHGSTKKSKNLNSIEESLETGK